MTKVVFRKWKDGEVIALFPDDTNPYAGTVTSYMHIGQHGDADYGHVIAATHPARPSEYHGLLAELITIGYADLHVVQRPRPNFH
ncbi:hypothetical protein A3BBH6_06800 [Alistipes onderdonkii subsp. vulgaris]|uniref:hypothetical protein n=1 Tax=Alistipes onderdonkii TaxID=328813 RepID=UPI00114394E1|nr:hypothetical protein [Alistipes onderdonkii]BBL00444.1 hypothetical protein A3BBH6_06800 [Alistipes onderdonkii subsp. vulgaris]